MNRARPSRLAASLAVVAAICLVACGDDDDDDTTAPTAGVAETTDTAAATDLTLSTEAPDTAESSDTTEPVDTGSTTSEESTPGGEVGSRDDYVEAATAEINWDDRELTECVAEAIVSDDVYAAVQDADVTVEQFRGGQLEEQGVTITDDQVAAIADDMAACGDLVPQLAGNEQEETCIAASFSNELMAEYLTASLFGRDQSAAAETANDEVTSCLTAAEDTTTTTG
jgi:hypothetical protein